MTLGKANNAEGSAFLSGVAMRLPDEIDEILMYELGRDNREHGIEHRYPAYKVSAGEALDAWIGRFSPGWPESFLKDAGYVASVETGVKEITDFLVDRAAKCPLEILVLGGYSQGAQVIGVALTDPDYGVPHWLRERIAFVALFGDPTLRLPKGWQTYVHVEKGPYGLWANDVLRPVACRGLPDDFEVYRRGNPPCETAFGILAVSEYRPTYLPLDMISGAFGSPSTTRVGSWCIPNDPICNNTAERALRYALSSDGFVGSHDDYANPARGPDGQTSWVKLGAREAGTMAALMWWANSWADS